MPKKSLYKKGPWTKDEDNILTREVLKNKNLVGWRIIANCIPSRNSKQCRERWRNTLDPSIINGPWTTEEDYLIDYYYFIYGKKWSKISKYIKGRSDNSIKNRWNTHLQNSNKINVLNIFDC